jgi:hypothetical protein
LTQKELVNAVKALQKKDPALAVHLHKITQQLQASGRPLTPSFLSGSSIVSPSPINTTPPVVVAHGEILLLHQDLIFSQAAEGAAKNTAIDAFGAFFNCVPLVQNAWTEASRLEVIHGSRTHPEVLSAAVVATDLTNRKADLSALADQARSDLTAVVSQTQLLADDFNRRSAQFLADFGIPFDRAVPPTSTVATSAGLRPSSPVTTAQSALDVASLNVQSASTAVDTATAALNAAMDGVSPADSDIAQLAFTVRSAANDLRAKRAAQASCQVTLDAASSAKRAKASTSPSSGALNMVSRSSRSFRLTSVPVATLAS